MSSDVCQLCGEETKLVNSHVFPEFFLEDTYDESHRFISVTSHPLQKPRPLQRGYTERLLCSACDGQLGQYESYAARLLRRADTEAAAAQGGVELTGVDFTTFRLFGLSLLWRAHIARGHMFGAVNLGQHAESLGVMLENQDPGQPHQFGFALAKVVGLELHGTMVIAPMAAKYKGHRAYRFMARGYDWAFVVSSTADQLKEEFPFVGSHQSLHIPFVPHDKRRLFASIRRAFPRAFRTE